MNERIRELAEESYNEFYNVHIDLELFVELIVQECAEIIDAGKIGYNQVPAEVALDLTAKNVKEHFGVK
jgi:hypothetical protein